jgi:hypothetical protein
MGQKKKNKNKNETTHQKQIQFFMRNEITV